MSMTSGTAAEFPHTPLSSLGRLREGDDRRRQHLERLSSLYWRPVYAFIRRTWNCERPKAEDLAQEFFVWAFESDLLTKFDPAVGNFRTFLKAVLRNFVKEEHRRGTALKRGGGIRFVPLDGLSEPPAPPSDLPPDDAFDRQWVRDVLEQALRELERDLSGAGHGPWFEALRMCDLEEPPRTYRDAAERLGVGEGDVRNYLHRARTRLREILAACLSEYIGPDEDVLAEMRDLLRI